MARDIASRPGLSDQPSQSLALDFATRRTPRTAAAPARDTMEPAAKKARGGGGDDDAARLAPQQSKTARTVDNADLKAWQYNVIAWKSCEDFAERLHASDPERFQYRETVWEKFDDSKMDHIIVGGFTPKNVMARCGPRSQPASQPASKVSHSRHAAATGGAGRTCCSSPPSTTTMPSCLSSTR